jgi:hypothetical protein
MQSHIRCIATAKSLLGVCAIFFFLAPVYGQNPGQTPFDAERYSEAKRLLDAKAYGKAVPLLERAAEAGNPAPNGR